MDPVDALYPLRFRPVLRRYLWGGRRLATHLGKTLGPGDDYAESWEICDRGPEQSIVQYGPLGGWTLAELVAGKGKALLGRHHPQAHFPLMVKFIDAAQPLSIQVHPGDAQAARLDPPDAGKYEAFVVMLAEPGSTVYAGLKPGVDRQALAEALRQGTCPDLLHRFQPVPGDCVFLPPGTVHALGQGLLVVEIQQASEVTFRLFDWNRLGPDGKARPLHVPQALEAIDFARGPVLPQRPQPTGRAGVERLVQCERFCLDRWDFDHPEGIGGDGRCHILCVLEGAVAVEGDPAGTPLGAGSTVLLPAALGAVRVTPQGRGVLLDAYLP
jgi:mannose-6-phosphate isomerase